MLAEDYMRRQMLGSESLVSSCKKSIGKKTKCGELGRDASGLALMRFLLYKRCVFMPHVSYNHKCTIQS